MIKAIEVYLVTNGNGMEAVEFYKNVLNAEVVSLLQWKDGVPNCPKENEELLMNAQLVVNGIRMMISDERSDGDYILGTNVSPTIITDDVETSKEIWEKLKVDAREIFMKLGETFWSPAYGGLIDKFRMQWQVSTEITK